MKDRDHLRAEKLRLSTEKTSLHKTSVEFRHRVRFVWLRKGHFNVPGGGTALFAY